jgi:hypothetical protein
MIFIGFEKRLKTIHLPCLKNFYKFGWGHGGIFHKCKVPEIGIFFSEYKVPFLG